MRSRRRKRRSFGPLLAVVFLLLLIAGAAAGFVIGRRYMPGKEMADKAELFHIKGSQVAILLNNELQEEKGIYEDGQVYLPISLSLIHILDHRLPLKILRLGQAGSLPVFLLQQERTGQTVCQALQDPLS